MILITGTTAIEINFSGKLLQISHLVKSPTTLKIKIKLLGITSTYQIKKE
jgi:hypothetical protein